MADAAKKRKMSKADKEKLKREEQERKAQEEANNYVVLRSGVKLQLVPDDFVGTAAQREAARLQALEEVKKQQKEEEEMAVERTKMENEERKTRRHDMEELTQILDNNREQLNQINEERRRQAKWSRYMRCDGSPDPVNQGEINTYINLRLEDNSRNDAVSVLKDSQLDLSLIEELKFLLCDTPQDQFHEKDVRLHYETISELESLVCTKLDLATLQILCDATRLADSDSGNLQHVVSNQDVALCVWGNLMKNPRVRSFEFTDLKLTFDIPRVLGLSDCAVRVLLTKFDHYSPSSKAAIPRRKKKEEVIEEAPPEEEKKEGEEEKQDEEKKEGEEEEEKEKEETEIDLMAALRGDTEGENQEEVKEEEEVLEEDFEDPPTPEPPEYEDFDEEDDIIDLRAYDVLGGIFHIDLLHMPPQPKTVGSWTITTLVDPPAIQPMEYSADPPPNPDDKDKNKDKKDEKPPITISMSLPADVLFLEEPQVARWDEKRKFWSTNGFSDFNFSEEAHKFSFKTTHFGTMCLLQDTHIHMPFQSWELRPHKLNSAVLTIIATIVEIEIEIKDALCCLSQPKDKPQLESIRGKWVTPAELIKMMKGAGVNVFPNEDSSKFVSIQNKKRKPGRRPFKAILKKHPLIEERTYQQMALTASAMAYSWSKWNNEREREEVIFQAAEALEDEPLLEEDWSVFLATKRRVMKLKMTEFDEDFNSAPTGDSGKCSQSTLSPHGGRFPSTLIGSNSEVALSTGSDDTITRLHSPSFKVKKGQKVMKKKAGKESKRSSTIKPGPTLAELFLTTFNIAKSPYKSNIYHLMSEVASEAAVTRVKETNFQFVDCVEQLLRATKVLTYA